MQICITSNSIQTIQYRLCATVDDYLSIPRTYLSISRIVVQVYIVGFIDDYVCSTTIFTQLGCLRYFLLFRCYRCRCHCHRHRLFTQNCSPFVCMVAIELKCKTTTNTTQKKKEKMKYDEYEIEQIIIYMHRNVMWSTLSIHSTHSTTRVHGTHERMCEFSTNNDKKTNSEWRQEQIKQININFCCVRFFLSQLLRKIKMMCVYCYLLLW